MGFSASGHMDHHETTSAEITGARKRDCQRKTRGNGSIYCVAALFQDLKTDGSRHRLLAGDHAVFRCHRMKQIRQGVDGSILRRCGKR